MTGQEKRAWNIVELFVVLPKPKRGTVAAMNLFFHVSHQVAFQRASHRAAPEVEVRSTVYVLL